MVPKMHVHIPSHSIFFAHPQGLSHGLCQSSGWFDRRHEGVLCRPTSASGSHTFSLGNFGHGVACGFWFVEFCWIWRVVQIFTWVEAAENPAWIPTIHSRQNLDVFGGGTNPRVRGIDEKSWLIIRYFQHFETFPHANVGFDPKPVTNPWFTDANPGFRNQNPGFGTPKPGFSEKPGFAQTRDEPMTNPWFTRDNPWFFSRVETSKTSPFFTWFWWQISIIWGWLIREIREASRTLICRSGACKFPDRDWQNQHENSYSS